MNTHRSTTVTSTFAAVLLAGLATLSACSDTTARSAAPLATANAAAPGQVYPSGATLPSPVATLPLPTAEPPRPPTGAPAAPTISPTTPTTAPSTTPPTTTAPTTTAPTTTTTPAAPLFVTRGPLVARLSDSCFSAVWPIRVWGTVENRSPLAPSLAAAPHDFDVSLQPQQYLDVIDDGGQLRGYEGDTQMVVTIHVDHFTDPGVVEVPLWRADGDLSITMSLDAVDVLAPATTCVLLLKHSQTVIGQI